MSSVGNCLLGRYVVVEGKDNIFRTLVHITQNSPIFLFDLNINTYIFFYTYYFDDFIYINVIIICHVDDIFLFSISRLKIILLLHKNTKIKIWTSGPKINFCIFISEDHF